MKKILLVSICGLFVFGGASQALAVTYDLTGQVAGSNVNVELEFDSTVITPPNPGPSDPDIDPDNPPITNPNVGRFGIRYVSDMSFGTHNVSSSDQIYYSKFDKQFLNNSQYNHLMIQNFIPDNDQWKLTLEQLDEFIPGGTLQFHPFLIPESTLNLTMANTLVVTETSGVHDFATATTSGNGTATILLNDGTNGVELTVPAYTLDNTYSATLEWTLVTGV